MHSACGSALTAALNVDGLNLIQSQPAKVLSLNVPLSLLADGMIELTMECPLLCQERTLRQLFDHLVGAGEQRGGQGQAERLGSLEVDDKLELGRLFYR